jgi:hypothetical protein
MTKSVLRRYTDIPSLIYLLSERKITLLDPRAWDDRNDSRYLAIYREKRGLASVLALCFTQSDETYHHWRVFADGPAGVCVRFERSQLLSAINGHVVVRAQTVKYRKLSEMDDANPRVSDLPFLKRFAFGHEKEFRVIYESKTKTCSSLDVPIPLSCIERITLSPWVHNQLSKHLKSTLKAIKGCAGLEIVRSTLIGNQQWQRYGESAES